MSKKNPYPKLKQFEYINCIVCDHKIDMVNPELRNKNNITKYEPSNHMWSGLVEKISAGYGSTLDGDMYYIGICDDCTRKKFKDGTLRYSGAYMNLPLEDHVIEASDKLRNRKNNLDDLIK